MNSSDKRVRLSFDGARRSGAERGGAGRREVKNYPRGLVEAAGSRMEHSGPGNERDFTKY